MCGDLLHQSYETSIVHKCVCIYTYVCVCLCVYVWLPQLHPEMFTLLMLLHTWDLSCYTTRVCSYLWRWVLVVRLCLTLRPHELQPTRPICHWGFTGKTTGVDSHSLLQDIFPTQGLTSGLLHRWQMTIWATREARIYPWDVWYSSCTPQIQLKKRLQLYYSLG